MREERGVVLLARVLDAVVMGIDGLHDRLAGLDSPPGTPRHLRQQLKRPLRRAEIGETQPDVGRHDPDERHAGKIVPLGDHLRTDEDVDSAGRHRSKNIGRCALATHGVAIEPCHAGRWPQC